MVRIEVDTSGFRGLMRDPDTRRKMGLALLRDVTAIERRQRGDGECCNQSLHGNVLPC